MDTQGLLLKAKVHSADIQDRDGGKLVLSSFKSAHLKEAFPRLSHLWVDSGYRGEFEEWVVGELGWSVEVVKRHRERKPEGVWMLGEVVMDWSMIEPPPELLPDPKCVGFQVLPRRWVVERTFGWLGWYRRLSKDYEYLPQSSEAFLYIAMSRLMVRRLRKLAEREVSL